MSLLTGTTVFDTSSYIECTISGNVKYKLIDGRIPEKSFVFPGNSIMIVNVKMVCT